MTRTLTSQSICPYCGASLPRIPTRKRHCPSCKKVMYVKLLDDGWYAVTKDELKIIEEEKRDQFAKRQRANTLKGIYKMVFGFAAVGACILVFILVLTNHGQNPSTNESTMEDSKQSFSQQTTSYGPYITGEDWVTMSNSEKSRWVGSALDAMVMGGTLSRNELKSISYYVSCLNNAFNSYNSRTSLVSWELIAFTS